MRVHKTRLALSALSLLGVAMLTILRPWPLKIIFDFLLLPGLNVSTTSNLSFLADWSSQTILLVSVAAVLFLAATKGVLTYSHAVLSKTVGHRLVAEIRLKLFSHVQSLPQAYHDYRETGELMTRMTGDIGLLQNLLVSTVITLVSQLLLIIGMFVVMLWLDWQLALVGMAVLPFLIFASFKFSGKIKSSARSQREQYGKIVASVQESLAGISQVKTYAQEKVREKIVSKSMSRDVKANVKTTRLTANYSRIVEMINAVGTAAVLWIGVLKTQSGAISAGDLLIFLAYLKGIYRPLQQIARLTTSIAKATVRGEKIMELLDMPSEEPKDDRGISAKGVVGEFRFDHVTFSYLDNRPVLSDFSCVIPKKKTTLILGHTGAGKSTIAKLLLRLYNVTQGEISLDGRNISEYRIRSLRKQITPLAQETFLFRTSIADNIAFGRRHATRDEVETAARLVGADTFIRQLPDGYDTLVGESGLTLSGGQRQRISFARAALRKSPIMIFDEPATGLDIHAEQEAKEVLDSFRAESTLIIITHRLHMLSLADWVIFIRNGRLVEQGRPDELLKNRGEFHAFVSSVDDPRDIMAVDDSLSEKVDLK